MNTPLRRELVTRAAGVCECGCRKPFGGSLEGHPTVDHFFGRGKAPESIENVWLIRWHCHFRKTNNDPTAGYWLLKFIAHSGRKADLTNDPRPYVAAAELAQMKLEWLTARKGAHA